MCERISKKQIYFELIELGYAKSNALKVARDCIPVTEDLFIIQDKYIGRNFGVDAKSKDWSEWRENAPYYSYAEFRKKVW